MLIFLQVVGYDQGSDKSLTTSCQSYNNVNFHHRSQAWQAPFDTHGFVFPDPISTSSQQRQQMPLDRLITLSLAHVCRVITEWYCRRARPLPKVIQTIRDVLVDARVPLSLMVILNTVPVLWHRITPTHRYMMVLHRPSWTPGLDTMPLAIQSPKPGQEMMQLAR